MNEPSPKSASPAPNKPKSGGDTWKWWYYILAGLGLAAWAVYQYVSLTAFEQEGGTRTMGRSSAFFYDLFGKWGVVGLLLVLAVATIGVGLWTRNDKPKAE